MFAAWVKIKINNSKLELQKTTVRQRQTGIYFGIGISSLNIFVSEKNLVLVTFSLNHSKNI